MWEHLQKLFDKSSKFFLWITSWNSIQFHTDCNRLPPDVAQEFNLKSSPNSWRYYFWINFVHKYCFILLEEKQLTYQLLYKEFKFAKLKSLVVDDFFSVSSSKMQKFTFSLLVAIFCVVAMSWVIFQILFEQTNFCTRIF